MRMHPILHYVRLHAGIDLRTYCNTPIYAARAGTVTWAKERFGFGNQVMVDSGYVNGNALSESYNHLTSWSVHAGQHVEQGQLIAHSGNTGHVGRVPPALRGLRERRDREPAPAARSAASSR